MGQCLSAPAHDTPERFKGRWDQGGLADGLAAFGGTDKYGALGEPAKPAYTTTADVGLGPKSREDKFGFMHDKAPTPLQLERIDEDATLQGGPDSSPLKAPPTAALAPGEGQVRAPRKPINWTRGELVGQGAFGSVFVAMDNDTGELIAVKQVHIPRGGGAHARKVEENIRSVEEEVQLLQQFDHSNIVRYLGTEKTEDSLNIFLEYVPGGSIASLLAKFGSFKESVIRVYTKQILLGLEYLHSKGVMHRDIKGANILVDNTGLVKLADFGASKKLEDLVTLADGNKSVKGTPYWMAPEVITQTGHGRQADLWSVACTVLEMATGRPPWSTQYPSQVAAMFHIASSKGPPEIPQHLSPECKDFLYLCFNRDWKARPLASTLLRHPFLADVPVRSHSSGPSPNAAVLAQAWRAPRASGGPSAAAAAVTGPEASEGQFGTPSPLNPKISAAAARAGMAPGAARISLQTGDGGSGESSAALSPLGQHAAARQQQWDSAAALTPQQQPPPQQQQQQARESSGAGPAFSGRLTGSPMKRPAMSLRASAPAFSGFASLALSQQALEQQMPLPARLAAAPAQVPQQAASNLRGSRDSGSMLAVDSSDAGVEDAAGSSSSAFEASPKAVHLLADAPTADTAAPAKSVPAGEEAEARDQAVANAGEDESAARTAAAQTPAVNRQRAPAATPPSIGTSSGTNKSDYNPMEEPSWMQPLESPLAEDSTPTSAIARGGSTPTAVAAAGSPQQAAVTGEATLVQETGSYAALLPEGQPASVKPTQEPVADGDEGPAPPRDAAAPVYREHPSADHMVWTNEDGDIDALPWDMGGWSTGSSGQRNEGVEEEKEDAAAVVRSGSSGGEGDDDGVKGSNSGVVEQAAKQLGDPVDEDALIGALRRKAQHDVRASLALFEKSLNIPAVHPPPSPKAAAVAAAVTAAGSPPLPVPPERAPLAEQPQPQPTVESLESRGSGGSKRDHRQLYPHQPAVAAASSDDCRRRPAGPQHLLPAGREAIGGARPAVTPLAAAVGGLAGLGFGSGRAGSGGSDRESIWQQELSQELFRVKTGSGSGVVANRRVSLHGSPLKRPGSIHQ